MYIEEQISRTKALAYVALQRNDFCEATYLISKVEQAVRVYHGLDEYTHADLWFLSMGRILLRLEQARNETALVLGRKA